MLSALGGFTVFVIVFTIIFVLFVVLAVRYRARIRALEREFRSLVKIGSDYIELPEECTVECGVFSIRSEYKAPAGKSSPPIEIKEFKIIDSKTVKTERLRVSEVCNHPFFIYNRGSDYYVIAPGFIIKSGKFNGFLGVCLNQEAIPHKSVRLQLADELNAVDAEVEVTNSSYRARIKWTPRVPVIPKVVYDEKTGLHKVIVDKESGSGARGARLELCCETLKGLLCMDIAKTRTPNVDVTAEFTWRLPQNPTFVFHYCEPRFLQHNLLHYDTYFWNAFLTRIPVEVVEQVSTIETTRGAIEAAGGRYRRLIEGSKFTIVGYAPRIIKARLVLDLPLRVDVVKMEEIQ